MLDTVFLLLSASLFSLGCVFALYALELIRRARRALREAEGLRLACASELRSIQAERRVGQERIAMELTQKVRRFGLVQ